MRISEQIKIKSTKDGDLSIKSRTSLRPTLYIIMPLDEWESHVG